ncbi:hypothetical protein QA641_31090 [Bradyrhizobium sp. CB1650]|uniref:hypothetical protein n=1 Tax=Bradyrhizobium sp. CB1650 TaxID=3039153 RepID=UPI002435FE00|nr:hypothetical protein [Bradyrhizobium sp. CB1650]WGD50053.1 hypothetical protein QA641_31090 [Bradyrhizobium sp. CB1650]
MATTHHTRIKQLESADAELADLRDQRARIDARIASLESTRKEELIALATDILNDMNLAQVPVLTIFAHLTALDGAVDRSDGDHPAKFEEDAEEKVEAFVKITRNTAIRKRIILEQCGLHWHGRDAGWTGVVGAVTLAKLREVFGDRVEKPPLIEPREPRLSAQESDAAPLCADEEPDGGGSEADAGVAEIANGDSTIDAAAPVPTTFFRGFPPRRSAQQQADEPS